jgi:hypothetical protein
MSYKQHLDIAENKQSYSEISKAKYLKLTFVPTRWEIQVSVLEKNDAWPRHMTQNRKYFFLFSVFAAYYSDIIQTL